jgi:hypothetical protein
MKKQAYTMIGITVLLGCIGVTAKAQCVMPSIATIPFEFSTGKVTLPAGKYKLTCFDASGSRLLLIRSTDGKTRRAAVQTIPVNGRWRDGGRLVFHRYGDRYFFVQMWAGGNTGLELPMTHAERTVARELAGIKPKTETIALTARQ